MLKKLNTIGKILNKKSLQSINGGASCFPLKPCDIGTDWDFGRCECVPSNS
ncbi:hypothetical protein [Tenacibaculum xiamenense]|uniref:hypothetical protein n=1 Tax=Tenacibaculum xiamenense TaxID=1261553 RepID=UPI0038B479FB